MNPIHSFLTILPLLTSSAAGATTYFVDPVRGDDTHSGTEKAMAWKSIGKVNSLQLAPGDQVLIGTGFHEETLKPSGAGTAEKPIVIRFSTGRHEFGVEKALRRAWHVSNSCDDPTQPRPVGILMENVKHFRIEGAGKSGERKTEVVFGGRMIEIVNDHAENITGNRFSAAKPSTNIQSSCSGVTTKSNETGATQ